MCLTVYEFSFILFIHHNIHFHFELCTYCNILDIYLLWNMNSVKYLHAVLYGTIELFILWHVWRHSGVLWVNSYQLDLHSQTPPGSHAWVSRHCCPACRTSLIATRFWVVVICPIIKCLTVLEFSFILFDLCLFITIFNFILNYEPIVTFWIFTYHKIWILLIIFCFIWSYWIIYFLTCLEVFWSVVS